MEYIEIGKRIREARLAKGFTQEYLAEKLNIDSSFISKVENGHKSTSMSLCIEICKLLDVSLDYIAQDVVPAAYQNVAEQRLREYLSQLNKKQTEYVLNEIENFIKFVNDK